MTINYKYKIVSKKAPSREEMKHHRSIHEIVFKDIELKNFIIKTEYGIFQMICHKKYALKENKTQLDALVQQQIDIKLNIKKDDNDEDDW